ncbi:type 4a pilus biogenesis protein PilO [bacterium]|nr:type 4a pilus biogenesis protein PilO [bacterium]
MQLNQNKIKKFTLEPKYLNFAGVIVFLVIVIAAYFGAESFSKEIKNKKELADFKVAELEARAINIKTFEDLQRKVKDFPEKIEILDKIKNEQQSIEQLISQLEKIAYVSGVTIPSMTPDATAVTSLQVALSASGNYDSLKKFFNGIENNQLILNISDITITGEEPDLTLSLTVKAGS